MINTPYVIKAREIAEKLHGDNVDECGYPIMRRLNWVAERSDDEEVVCASYLQGILSLTGKDIYEFMTEEGFSMRITFTAEFLNITPDIDKTYSIYIKRISEHDLATRVMILDLEYRADPDNYKDPDHEMKEKILMYKDAQQELVNADRARNAGA